MHSRALTLDWHYSYAKLNFGRYGGMGERLIPPDCKSGARKGYVGSNPTPSTRSEGPARTCSRDVHMHPFDSNRR